MSETMHLVYGTDDNYWFPTAVSAASAAFGTKCELAIHLFDLGVSDAHYDEHVAMIRKANPAAKCVRHVLDKKIFEGFGAWRGSLATYSRMLIAEILPDLDWAIYVDGDTLWLGDVAKLWALRDESKLIQASIDPPTTMETVNTEFAWYAERGLEVDPAGYLCMGLMLANLKKMREERIAEKCQSFMQKYPCPHIVDQTVLNYVCQGRTAPLPPEWGVFSVWHGRVRLMGPCCIHYCQDLPWKRHKINRLISDIILPWYVFCERILGLNLRRRYLSPFSWGWRRFVFVLLKYNQWVLRIHPYIRSRLRNTHGLTREEWRAIEGMLK